MGKDIDELGRVVLDGLFFDHDKATLTPESKPALDEIAKFLTMRPELSVYVVGHTDSTGSFDYNETLSRDRAGAVAAALVDRYGIAAERLEAHGVGPLVPVFTNQSAAESFLAILMPMRNSFGNGVRLADTALSHTPSSVLIRRTIRPR